MLLLPLPPRAAAVVSAADWSQYRSGPARLGLNTQETVLSPSTVSGLRQAWVTTAGDLVTEPAVVGGVVYVGSADRRGYALNAATGAIVWTATTGGRVLDPPAVADGVVYVRARDGNAYALDAATGAIVWTASIGGSPMFGLLPDRSSPAVTDGMVYVAGPYNGRLYALDAATGATVWTATRGDTVSGTLAVAAGIVYALLGRGLGAADLLALNADTGAVVWTVPGDQWSSPSSVSPVVANGVLYTGTINGVLVARNPATRAVLWSDATMGGLDRSRYASLVVANGAVYAGRGVAVSAHRLQNPARRTRLDGPVRRPAPRLAH